MYRGTITNEVEIPYHKATPEILRENNKQTNYPEFVQDILKDLEKKEFHKKEKH